jgi:hypothetical protein
VVVGSPKAWAKVTSPTEDAGEVSRAGAKKNSKCQHKSESTRHMNHTFSLIQCARRGGNVNVRVVTDLGGFVIPR